MRLLVVEDDARLARVIAKGLRDAAYAVDVAEDGDRALREALATEYDAIVLDVMLPGRDGFDVVRRLREAGRRVPVLMLTARDTVDDRVGGLDAGADDYLVKPFEFAELLARLRALLRRTPVVAQPVLAVDDLEVDTTSHVVRRGGDRIALTAKEYAMLEYLARNAGRVVSRTEITDHVWDENHDPFTNAIEVYINRLRRKVDAGRERRLIHTHRGAGYRLGLGESPA